MELWWAPLAVRKFLTHSPLGCDRCLLQGLRTTWGSSSLGSSGASCSHTAASGIGGQPEHGLENSAQCAPWAGQSWAVKSPTTWRLWLLPPANAHCTHCCWRKAKKEKRRNFLADQILHSDLWVKAALSVVTKLGPKLGQTLKIGVCLKQNTELCAVFFWHLQNTCEMILKSPPSKWQSWVVLCRNNQGVVMSPVLKNHNKPSTTEKYREND